MANSRLTGPNAGALKYDVLTMMAVAGLSGPAVLQTTMLRLIAIVTARYNWARDELVLGQREMARIWSVEERTAKREVRRMADCGVLVCLRPGVRGRVATYRLDLAAIARLGAADWSKVGPDFEDRLTAWLNPRSEVQPRETVVRVDFTPRDAPATERAGGWPAVLRRLEREDPNMAAAWLRQLGYEGDDLRALRLVAPSTFHANYVRAHLLSRIQHVAREFAGEDAHVEILCRSGGVG